ncbi:hypothetical protein EN852_029690 [Mesorhizobium sp. M2E.F.Ca.ET.209.01.1.1]|uniref:hypothetical protein n=1 Tax=Mesorhizobium sp. M2E.F.Ca.ET.209.01.1.1 TaxID=2500526 RepID=UPI000FDA1250|nr:hypothetical protein [Mesorhizobium sp. M2E.F.Ca.ET.209.01.1.1]TGS09794.1 hypothetical protein EN852_029690 [Mesorhizobium sp. M2E.F.Ca.ET.209.01.1.1]
MHRAFQINVELPEEILQRVAERLADIGYALTPWPAAPLGGIAGLGDVAVLVLAQGLNLSQIDQRISNAVRANVRIVVIRMDETELPLEAGSFSSSVVTIGSPELSDAFDEARPEIQEDSAGKTADTKKIRHNKC